MNSLRRELINKELEEGIPVYLNVYHLTPANYVIQLIGFGFFHTTIEVKDTEYSFGATQANISGIFYNRIGYGPKGITIKEKKYLGNTIYNERTIKNLLQLYLPYWQGNSYDPFMKNCNHFTKFLASKLIKSQKLNYPQYVNRIIAYGLWLNAFYSPIKRLYGSLACQPNDYTTIAHGNDNANANEPDSNPKINMNDVHIGIPHSNDNDLSSEPHINNKTEDNSPFLQNNDEDFFNRAFITNQFLTQYKDNIGNSSYLNYFAIADDLLLNKKQYDKAMEIYQRLLTTIDSTAYEDLKDFKRNFIVKKYILPQQPIGKDDELKELRLLIKIKLLHCIQYTYYKTKQYHKHDITVNMIIGLNKRDYYAMMASAYIKYKENKYPECFQLLHSALLDCPNEAYKAYLKHFLSIIDKIELS